MSMHKSILVNKRVNFYMSRPGVLIYFGSASFCRSKAGLRPPGRMAIGRYQADGLWRLMGRWWFVSRRAKVLALDLQKFSSAFIRNGISLEC